MSSITKQTNKVGSLKQEKVRYQNRYKVVNDCLLKCGGKGIKLAGKSAKMVHNAHVPNLSHIGEGQ